MKKMTNLLAASALVVVAAQASAATHSISGTGVSTADQTAVALAAGTTIYAGEADLVGTVFTGTYTDTQVGATGYITDWDITWDIGTGLGTSTLTACTVTGYVDLCAAQFNSLIGQVNNIGGAPTPIAGGFQLQMIATGVPVDVSFDNIPDGTITVTQTYNFTANASEVPVPAAAWLFGSALVGLVGVGRKRK